MNKKNRLTIGIITAIVLLACACPASGLPAIGNSPVTSVPLVPPVGSQATVAAPAQNADVLYSDDFSVESSELETFTDNSGVVETKGGAYVVHSKSDLWNWGKSKSEFSDTVIEFDASLVSGPANNNAGYGVICRLKSRDDKSIDGYLLGISGDGYYSIRSISSGTMSSLVDWTFSDSINQGTGSNKIRATCNGSDLSLEVNGNLLASANTVAGASSSGSFAFATVSFETDEPAAETHFDNLVISKP
jgi:hypothetical protein